MSSCLNAVLIYIAWDKHLSPRKWAITQPALHNNNQGNSYSIYRFEHHDIRNSTDYCLFVFKLKEHYITQVCSTPEFLAKEMDHLHKVLHYLTQLFQQGKPQQKANKNPNPSTRRFIEEARVGIPYIKGLSQQYRHTLAKYRVRVFFKDTSTFRSLLMHPKDPIPDAQKTDIIYHWKCPATTAQLNT